MDHAANQPANQSLDHVPFGADPAMRQGGPGTPLTAAAMVTYTTLAVKNPNPAAPEISNRIGCAQPGFTLAFLETDFRIVGLPPDRPNLPPMFALHGSAGLMCRGNWDHVLEQAKKRAGELGHWIIQQPRASNDPLLLAPNR